ncbi:cupin domain-containing protein [Paenibacillus timonensis]|uniref:cupin domain-containing protein n=1 Tax=Paenibacillus timonensis TaxID=225915 RepID=UPI003F9D10DB
MAHLYHADRVTYHLKQSPIPEFAWHTSERLAELSGSKHLTFDIRSLDPGKYSYPYHFHRNAEELFVILEGSALLRTPEGKQELQTGDVVFFEMGPSGAHQLLNHTEKPCKYLDIRTNLGLDVCEYPDSGKINILPYQEIYDSAGQVDYFKGEDQVADKWADKESRIENEQ